MLMSDIASEVAGRGNYTLMFHDRGSKKYFEFTPNIVRGFIPLKMPINAMLDKHKAPRFEQHLALLLEGSRMTVSDLLAITTSPEADLEVTVQVVGANEFAVSHRWDDTNSMLVLDN